jgi:hypothetical protein
MKNQIRRTRMYLYHGVKAGQLPCCFFLTGAVFPGSTLLLAIDWEEEKKE